MSHGGCHHDIDGGTHTDHIHIDMIALQMSCLSDDQSVLNTHIRSQSLEALDMLVNGPAADVAAAGKSHLGFFIFAQ